MFARDFVHSFSLRSGFFYTEVFSTDTRVIMRSHYKFPFCKRIFFLTFWTQRKGKRKEKNDNHIKALNIDFGIVIIFIPVRFGRAYVCALVLLAARIWIHQNQFDWRRQYYISAHFGIRIVVVVVGFFPFLVFFFGYVKQCTSKSFGPSGLLCEMRISIFMLTHLHKHWLNKKQKRAHTRIQSIEINCELYECENK